MSKMPQLILLVAISFTAGVVFVGLTNKTDTYNPRTEIMLDTPDGWCRLEGPGRYFVADDPFAPINSVNEASNPF